MNRQAPKDLFSSDDRDKTPKPANQLPDLSIPELSLPTFNPPAPETSLPPLPELGFPTPPAITDEETAAEVAEEGTDDFDPLAWESEPVASPETQSEFKVLHAAGAPETATASVYALATHTNPSVREQVAYNPAAPENVLDDLAQDENPYIRAAVLENPSTSDETYDRLGEDENEYVVSAYIKNERTTRVKLTALKSHPNEFIAYMAEKELEDRANNQ